MATHIEIYTLCNLEIINKKYGLIRAIYPCCLRISPTF